MGEVIGFNEKLNERQTRAVLLLADGFSPSEVAEQVGVNLQTIYNWKSNNQEFASQLDTLRREVFAEELKQLRGLVGPASAAFREILTDEGASANAKVAAARVVFSAVRPDSGPLQIGISTTTSFSRADYELLRKVRNES